MTLCTAALGSLTGLPMFDRHPARNDYQSVGTEASALGMYLVAEIFLQSANIPEFEHTSGKRG
jgi:hypothetical protein